MRPISIALHAILPLLAVALCVPAARGQVVPQEKRGRSDAERQGYHDANNIRTEFWNYGMVGNYPPDPIGVDLSVFHSVEVPKGSGVNYSDGTTPFVLAKITQTNSLTAYIMETGYRERQGESPLFNRVMRFEPRPGYFQADPAINQGRSPALSNDPRTWPDTWPDKDNTWDGFWDGYFGKRAAADQESFTVMDDDYYDAWQYVPDSRDPTRRGLGLRIEVRGFQWSNPQASNVIFWHYDITNEGTTDYPKNGEPENIIFGLYMDSGVGGSAISCDGIAESDDDNAFFDRSTGLNLVYTWDKFSHGRGLSNNCATTGYLGYAYLETPGKPFDAQDNDLDGMTDEKRDGDPGQLIIGQGAIAAAVAARYNLTRFEQYYGKLDDRPAYRMGRWWTGDEDMDWVAEFNDFGADGIPKSGDPGEGDGMPTSGETNFGKTDINESDQIGLTGFKMNRIRVGQGNPATEVDNVIFFTDPKRWPERLFTQFSSPIAADRFDPPLAANYNIGFLFASGPFTLKASQTERFSLALAFGADLEELRNTVKVVQAIYDANYQFAVPPPAPTVKAETGDAYVQLSWDDAAERAFDPVALENDFEGYRVYRSTDPDFRDVRVIVTGRGTGPIGNGKPIAQFDIKDGLRGFSSQTVEGIAYYLGSETGLSHSWRDTTVTNGQQYYYAVTAYDYGPSIGEQSGRPAFTFYPSENSYAVSRTLRGGTILPKNVVVVRPNPKVAGYVPADVSTATRVGGTGAGSVGVKVVNSALVPDGHLFHLSFNADPDSVHPISYTLKDSTTREILYATGDVFDGSHNGQVGKGVLAIVETPEVVEIDSSSGFVSPSTTNAKLSVTYKYDVFPINYRRTGFPDDITITFSNTVLDTSVGQFPLDPLPVKFKIVAHTPSGDRPLKFLFFDIDGDSTLSHVEGGNREVIQILTGSDSLLPYQRVTWMVQLTGDDTSTVTPTRGDVFALRLNRPFSAEDAFTFTTSSERITAEKEAADAASDPYVVPNPYVGAASFEPDPFGVQGRGDRRLEFRNIVQGSTIRIFTIRGELVQTLYQDGSTAGYVPWDLRSKDNLDVAPGLYVYHVESAVRGTFVGKFALIK